MTQEQDNQPSQPHRRRPRYSGTHPRKFDQRYKELNPEKYPQMQQHIRAHGRTPAGTHVPVLLKEVLSTLRPRAGEIVADCTLGYGGHAGEFLKRIAPNGKLIGLDMDGRQLEKTRQRLEGLKVPFSAYHSNFAGLPNALQSEGLDGFDIIFADLGVSSMQVDDPSRGISYKNEGPLDMRMDDRLKATGADLLASLPERELSRALWEYSDEPDHVKIAHFIVQQRAVQPITQTGQLVRLIMNAKGFSDRGRRKPWQVPGGLHPAARTFQALRILVNDELGSLRQLLRVAPHCLRPGGRIGIISFHSGEDRLVKQAFRDGLQCGIYEEILQKVISPGYQEVRDNPRSASAKLRWARKFR